MGYGEVPASFLDTIRWDAITRLTMGTCPPPPHRPSPTQHAEKPMVYGTRQVHSKLAVFECEHCRKVFPKKADRERHLYSVHRDQLHSPKKLIDCPERDCHRRGLSGFTRKDNLLDHRRRVHNVNIPKRYRTARL